jgi:hypothetical protein
VIERAAVKARMRPAAISSPILACNDFTSTAGGAGPLPPLENDFLEGALTKAGLLSAKR